MEADLMQAVLCYVEDNWAYFTTRGLSKQWGDDWDDAPYEHNAGTPYEWNERWGAFGVPFYHIVKVAFDGPFERPCDPHLNSPYSVQRINSGAIAWLTTERWCDKIVAIPAGTTLSRPLS